MSDTYVTKTVASSTFTKIAEPVSQNALEISDEEGNVALAIDRLGNLRTANFNSSDSQEVDTTELQNQLDLTRCDFGKEMALNINYYVENDAIVLKCKPSSLANQTAKIFTAVGGGVARGSGCFVNFGTGVIGFYAGLASTSSQTVRYSRQSTLTFVAGHEYVIEMRRQEKLHTLKVTDAYTLESDSYEIMPISSNDIGEHWGKRSYNVTSGISVISFKDYSLDPYNCRLLIIGDSFIEGATGFVENHSNRYCMRMKRLLQGSCAINGFGGATTEQVSAFYEAYCKTLFKPDYVLIACGTNNNNYSTWLTAEQNLIASIKAAGSIPVLVTITFRGDQNTSAFVKQANSWIRNTSGELYIDFNIITTTNFDGQTQNLALFATDKVHPLPSTHILMTKRALLDVPEIFNLDESYAYSRKTTGGI